MALHHPYEQADALTPIEQQIARALITDREFRGRLTPQNLIPIFKHVLVSLVQQQKFAGTTVHVTSQVKRMQVAIAAQEMSVNCDLVILRPIKAELAFRYVLQNDPGAELPNLRLKHNQVHVEEITDRFDFIAKTALRALDVAQIAQSELNNPAQVIAKTLPNLLHGYGFARTLHHIELTLRSNALDVVLID